MEVAILDTNIVLDWLVFRDPWTQQLAARLESGTLVWRATPAMRREFEHVLTRACFERWQPDATAAADAWDRLARMGTDEPPPSRLVCADPHDQVFLDLALHHGCTWLISRDRVLLRLARRAAAWRVAVLTPQAWLARASASASAGGPTPA